jgi:hypothetical protein
MRACPVSTGQCVAYVVAAIALVCMCHPSMLSSPSGVLMRAAACCVRAEVNHTENGMRSYATMQARLISTQDWCGAAGQMGDTFVSDTRTSWTVLWRLGLLLPTALPGGETACAQERGAATRPFHTRLNHLPCCLFGGYTTCLTHTTASHPFCTPGGPPYDTGPWAPTWLATHKGWNDTRLLLPTGFCILRDRWGHSRSAAARTACSTG